MAKELRSKLELIFMRSMRSTRNDKEGGLGGGMCRGELLEEAIFRCPLNFLSDVHRLMARQINPLRI